MSNQEQEKELQGTSPENRVSAEDATSKEAMKEDVSLKEESSTKESKKEDSQERKALDEKESNQSKTKDEPTNVTQPQVASVPPKKPAATPRPRPAAKKPVEEKPLEPSHKQPWLDKFVANIKDLVGPECLEDAFINRANDHLPTLVVKSGYWRKLALHLRNHSDCQFDYVQNYSSVDYETHLEVVLHLFSFQHKERLGVRVKVDRTEATVDSVADIWATANWNEREAYDLMGITFVGHPDLRRIMLTDQWIGYPLRKDYVPYDEGV